MIFEKELIVNRVFQAADDVALLAKNEENLQKMLLTDKN